MTLAALHRWSMVGCCTLGALGTAGGSDLLGLAAAALVIVLIATSGQLHDEQRSTARLVLVHGVTVVVLVLALLISRRAQIDSVVVIVELGLFNRFVLRQGLRDDLILLGAAAVLLAVSTTITPGLTFLPLFVGFVWLAFGALRSAQIIGLAQTEPESRRASVRAMLLQRRAPTGQAGLSMVAMAFIFVGYLGLTLFPKHHFARLLGAGSFMTLSGATDSMTLTNDGVGAGRDGTVVMRVSRVSGGESLLTGLYARLYALDAFDGRRWHREGAPRALFSISRGRRSSASPSERVQVTLNRMIRRRGHHPVAALGRTRPARLLEIESRTRSSVDGTWYLSIPRTALRLNYGVDLGEDAPTVRFPAAAQRALRRRWLALPDDLDPRIRELGRQLTDSATTAADKIRSVLGHFSAGYQYSLDPMPGDAPDPLARFLFEARQGHCELYAGAVAALLRVGGVPARVATGYYGGWWNSTGQALEFTDQDAHAWVEVYDPDRGWIWVDATPASERARRRTKAWAWIRDLYDTLDALWFNNVVDFDEQKRRALLGRLAPDWWQGHGDAGPGLTLGFGESARRSGPTVLLGVVVGMGLVLLLGWRLMRRRRKSIGDQLRSMLDPDGDSSLPLGRLLAAVPAPCRSDAEAVVGRYDQWRFGAKDDRKGRPPADLERSIRRLGTALRAARRQRSK